jgi:hypothetical protein
MAILEYPTVNTEYIAINNVYLVANDASVEQYCNEKGLILETYESEERRFSNDGSLYYQYWNGTEWILESGFKKIVSKLTYS